ncbi:putative D-lactate dehydrogenase, mitochondrial [Wickerhamomyces ciferrii]|uniref:D-lactate dehydrogenase (cytochrome) n=1 Tax=Wickerhamomyces ciferrii (strain ATCC 14091 / BCRC 22168 / CBS 111 / JCM 3599 / NBRC 0793 / NRRL Y-1031 F-60-10) TaxID=1206466 RepID=K0KAP8_WICCF|nr:putative D-lactate dehydrogenase, mitochondrial [Wickerhamomyces ciferrii]CCH42065.1 putative D-lactate dehydrogenase, mitochondrial [Wickerhamomyces ciferrii]
MIIKSLKCGLNSIGRASHSFRPQRAFLSQNRIFYQSKKSSLEHINFSTRANFNSYFIGAALFATGGFVSYGIFQGFDRKVKNDKSITKLNTLDPIKYGSLSDLKKAFQEIEQYLGPEFVTRADSEIENHTDSYYQTHHPLPGQRPKLIVYPKDTEQVSGVLKISHKYKVPIVPFSGGTSLEGQFIASRSGITIDLNRLDKVLELNEDDLDVVVQPSVPWQDLNEYLSPYGLMFGPDPGPGAQIGGMIGTSCSGTNAARYGTMKDNVLGLTVVLADGTIVKTKKRPRKSSAGYNLTGLFVGSEGTLGIVTEATLKLHVKPEEETVAVINFDTIKDATNSVSSIVRKGIQVNAVEFLDSNMMKCINDVGSTSKTWLEKPTLMIKIGGSKSIIKELVGTIKEITTQNNSTRFQFANDEEEKAELWSARRFALWSTIDWGKTHIDPNIKVYITDVAVPISKLSKVITETQDDILANGFNSTTIGHVGDGNFHALVLYKDEESDKVKKLVGRMVDRAINNDGTCTGEHGVGVGKREYLLKEVGEDAVDTMRHIKLALDPLRLLNPDKIFKIDPSDTNEH